MNRRLAAGSRDEFGKSLQKKQEIIFEIIKQLDQKGFLPIKTPLIERENTFDHYPNQDMFHLYDQAGDNLVLKPDMTLPVARFLGAHHQGERPIDLYYVDEVFRRAPYLSGSYNQETQAGIELIGDETIEAEKKGIKVMLDFAEQFQISDVKIVLSDSNFIDRILSEFDTISKNLKIELKKSIEEKNISQFKILSSKIPNFPEYLKDWPLAFGDLGEQVMKKLYLISGVKKIIDKWLLIADFIHQKYPKVSVTVDLAAKLPQPYYTGTIIQGFVPSLGKNLFSGGRYDRLIENYHQDLLPALGMGLNIETLIQAQTSFPESYRPIIVVLAKGRVEADVRSLLKVAGIDTTPLNDQGRKLIFDSPDQKFRFILVKPTDVLKYLDRGIGDLGIVGSDTIYEQLQNHYDVLDLETGKAKFVVAAPDGFNLNSTVRHRIATKYPKMASKYFNGRGQDVELIKLEGSVELGPLTGLSDAIVDISQTGNTLSANHLKIYDEVADVSTHLIIRKEALLKHQKRLTKIINNLSNKLAKEKKYENN